MNKDKNKTLLAITAAALSLPGILPKPCQAAAVTEDTTISYRYSEYTEAEMEQEKVIEGDVQRYTIDVHQLRFKTAISEDTEITLDALQESMSGASPWYVIPDQNGNPVQVMSSATIMEERSAVDLNFTSYFTSSRSSTSLGYSTEDDYGSFNFKSTYTSSFNQNNTDLEFGVSASRDLLKPVSTTLFEPNVGNESKSSMGALLGFSQTLSKTSIISNSISYTVYDGYLSDPYKQAYVDGDILPDARPDNRQQWAWMTRYRKFFEGPDAALHLDYRYYVDDWEITSHTLEIGWVQNLWGSWQIAPYIRGYTQEQAVFYQHFYQQARADGYYSSDYRLSTFVAASARLKLTKLFSFGSFNLFYESYTSEGESETDSNPALVSFDYMAAGLEIKF